MLGERQLRSVPTNTGRMTKRPGSRRAPSWACAAPGFHRRGWHGELVSGGAEPGPAPAQLAGGAEMPSWGRGQLGGAVENALASLDEGQVAHDHAGEGGE